MSRPTRGKEFSPTDTLPFVQAPQAEEPVALQQLDISVTITGLLASTSQTMRFFNPNRRDLEGSLTFPLPENATVVGYALDVDNQMIDGVPVPKQEARRILEAEERKGADPGIMEQAGGNIYRTRIYPLPAGGSRLVRIDTTAPLVMEGNDAAFHLPLGHAEEIDDVVLTVAVVQSPVKPTINSNIGNLSLSSWEDRAVAEAQLGKGVSTEDLLVRLPDLPDQIVMVEETDQGETFFCLSQRTPQPAQKNKSLALKRIALAWDASGSRRNIDKDLDFIRQLSGLHPDMVVDVAVFRNRGFEKLRTFDLSRDKTASLISWLEEQPRDGATDFSALDLNRFPREGATHWLLFTDGIRSSGSGLPACGDKPVVAICSQADADLALLSYLAGQTGGQQLNLLTTPVQAAQKLMEKLSAEQPRADVESADSIHTISGWNRINLVGRMQGKKATCRWRGMPRDTATVAVEKAAATPGSAIARFWAGLEAQRLSLTTGGESDEVAALGQHYGVVTPGTSLLVLESLEQYLEYSIEPPATRPEMRLQYLASQRDIQQEKKQEEKGHLDHVYRLWQNRLEWHEKGNPPMPPPDKGVQSGSVMESTERMFLDAGQALTEESAAPTRPAPAPTEADLEDIVLGSGGQAAAAGASVKVLPWDPRVPYLASIKSVDDSAAYGAYLQQRRTYAGSPAFFLDCGDHLLGRGLKDQGLRVLSNLLETGLDDPALMRMYAWRLQQAGEIDLAVQVFERVRSLRDDEPQSHRDLALALADRWQASGGEKKDALHAMELLWQVIRNPWERFPEIEIIALMELNRLIRLAQKAGIDIPGDIDQRFIRLVDVGLRISMSWDADLTDIDLHVFEPDGGHAYYAHNRTRIGGLVSRDFTQGYGPEEYVLKEAAAGKYQIKSHYYGSSQQSVCGPCTVVVNIFTDYGRDSEQKKVLTLRLDKPGEEILVGEIEVKGDGTSDKGPADAKNWREKFRSLRKGMTVDEIVAVVGQPVGVRGSGRMVMVYQPENGVEIHVTLDPVLTTVQQMMDGAVRDLIRKGLRHHPFQG